MPDRVFVYGTLMHGGSNHSLIRDRVVRREPGSIPGVLLDLGGYPGWVGGAGRVHGEVLTLRDMEAALVVLDHLEEYFGPGSPDNLYEREVVRVMLSSQGVTVSAWCYRYLGSTDGAAVLPGGVWPVAGKGRRD